MLGVCGSRGLLGGELWQSDEVAGCGEEVEDGDSFSETFDLELGQSGAGLGPAEDFFDAFSASQVDFIAGVACCTTINGGFAPFAGFTDGAIVWADTLILINSI